MIQTLDLMEMPPWPKLLPLSEENWRANSPHAVWKVIHPKEPNLFISLLMLKRVKKKKKNW
jgi:hypothetical protein